MRFAFFGDVVGRSGRRGLADHLPDLTPAGEPERLRSSMINGIKHWQVDYSGSTAS